MSLGNALAERLGLLRSLAIYRGIPGRARRLWRFYTPWVKPGDLCFDIGAHVGNHASCWRTLGAHVVALEPQPRFARYLRHRFAGDPQVTVLEAAVGAVPGRAQLQLSPLTPTVSTLAADWAQRVAQAESFRRVRWEPGPEVEVTTVDALVARYGVPAYVKIDVEGHEAEVLRGLSQPLAALSFEFIPATIEAACGCVERLASLGEYRFNWSIGERYQLEEPAWLGAAAMRDQLVGMGRDAPSGDVYARLVD